MSNVEMSKGLRDRLWNSSTSRTTTTRLETCFAIKEDLVDWNNDADTRVIGELSWAYECLQNVASDTFGKQFMAEMDKMNSLTTD